MFSDDLFSSLPRGIRNNNPLNLKHVPRNKWKGLVGNDGTFCIFSCVHYGFRAAYKTMLSYRKRDPNIIVERLIRTWCPDKTADSYVRTVERLSGIMRWEIVPFDDVDKMALLIESMTKVECGSCPFSLFTIKYAIEDK